MKANQLNLSQEELNELIGGVAPLPGTGEADIIIKNKNKNDYCICEYDNYNVIINNNKALQCACKCIV